MKVSFSRGEILFLLLLIFGLKIRSQHDVIHDYHKLLYNITLYYIYVTCHSYDHMITHHTEECRRFQSIAKDRSVTIIASKQNTSPLLHSKPFPAQIKTIFSTLDILISTRQLYRQPFLDIQGLLKIRVTYSTVFIPGSYSRYTKLVHILYLVAYTIVVILKMN